MYIVLFVMIVFCFFCFFWLWTTNVYLFSSDSSLKKQTSTKPTAHLCQIAFFCGRGRFWPASFITKHLWMTRRSWVIFDLLELRFYIFLWQLCRAFNKNGLTEPWTSWVFYGFLTHREFWWGIYFQIILEDLFEEECFIMWTYDIYVDYFRYRMFAWNIFVWHWKEGLWGTCLKLWHNGTQVWQGDPWSCVRLLRRFAAIVTWARNFQKSVLFQAHPKEHPEYVIQSRNGVWFHHDHASWIQDAHL